VQVSSIGNRVTDIDADAKAYGSIRGLIAVVDRNLLLHPHGTTHRSVYAVKDDQQRVTRRLHHPAAMLLDRWVYQSAAEPTEPSDGSCIIEADQAGIASHVRVQDGYQPSPPWGLTDQV
jgi:hypothetical protein